MDKFTWFPKFGEAMMRIPDERMRERFAYAVAVYGCTGETVELAWPLDAIFAACVEDVDNSKQAAACGSKGGRPRKSAAQDAKPQDCKTENPGFCESETPGFENAKAIPNQSIPYQSNPDREDARATGAGDASLGDGGADPLGEPACAASPAKGCPRPTPGEVEAFVAASGGWPISGEDFVGYYDDHGWPARGWQGSAMRWSRNERDRAAQGRASPGRDRAQAELARREAAELGRRYGEDERTEEVR